jgi:hypothetical protein
LSDFTKREKPTTYIGNAFAEIPVVRGMKREELDSLMKSYKFTPRQEGEAAPQAGTEQPRTPAPAIVVEPGTRVGEEKQFKQGPGIWDGSKWVPKGQQ